MEEVYKKDTSEILEKHFFKDRKIVSSEKNNFFYLYIIDWFLLTLAFIITYLAKKGTLNIGSQYLKFYPYVFLWWFISLLISNKFKSYNYEKRRQIRLEPYFISILFFGGMIAIQILFFGQYNMSRIIIFGTLLFYLFFEIIFLSGLYFTPFRKKKTKEFSFSMFVFEILYILGFIFFIPYFKEYFSYNSDSLQNILFAFTLFWVFNSLLIHRFRIIIDKNYIKTIFPFIKSMFTYMSFISFIILFFGLISIKKILFLTTIFFSVFELTYVSFLYLKKRFESGSELTNEHYAITNSWEAKRINEVVVQDKVERKKFTLSKKSFLSNFVKEKLRTVYLKDKSKIYKFINENIGLNTIDILNAEIIDSANPYHTEMLPKNSLELFINLHKFNSYKETNKYFINVHSKLKKEGIYISKFESSEKRRIYYRLNYPQTLGNILYIFDFIWKRVFSKLPILRNIYTSTTRGRNRVYSLAEGLGRLHYCGFELIALQEIENYVYFIVKKAKDPIINLSSSSGLLFSQRRVGKNGKMINVHKMRTMHPYSEYIHKYALEKGNLSEKGKIHNDFRITFWGRIFRRFWIDELPMLINYFKGEMKLIGVRPLSTTFFELYPDDLKKNRVMNKPGLLPPFYADLPDSLEKVFESERIYLEKYKNSKLRTDFSYFFSSLYNIIIKRAKSG